MLSPLSVVTPYAFVMPRCFPCNHLNDNLHRAFWDGNAAYYLDTATYAVPPFAVSVAPSSVSWNTKSTSLDRAMSRPPAGVS